MEARRSGADWSAPPSLFLLVVFSILFGIVRDLMRLLQCRLLQMTPLSKVKQRYSAAYMGSTASISPDGDGIETLPWLANDDIKVHADFKHVLLGGDLQRIQIKRRFGRSYRVVRSRPCRIRLTIGPRKLQPLFCKICTYRPVFSSIKRHCGTSCVVNMTSRCPIHRATAVKPGPA